MNMNLQQFLGTFPELKNVIALSSVPFLFRFLPIALVLYWACPGKGRNAVLFIVSLLFYGLGTQDAPWMLVLLLGLVAANYVLAAFALPDSSGKASGKTSGKTPVGGQKKEAPKEAGDEEVEAAGRALAHHSFTEEWNAVSVALAAEITRIMSEDGARPKLDWDAEESARRAREQKRRRTCAWAAVLLDVLVLSLFKGLSAAGILGLPLGISFFLFKMLSFQGDILRGKICKRLDFPETAAYFTLFFQITQGPIMRFSDGGQRQSRLSLEQIEEGLFYIACGLGMKVLLADRIFVLWNEIGKIGYESISTPLSWLGALAYTLELYYDFWGYSLIAGGVGILFGFPFIENFHHPYAANGIGDFYRRWHMTLGSFYRDYIYIPLGGNRRGEVLQIRNLMAVWILTGLWHGTTANFLLWGAVLGLLIVLERFVLRGALKASPVPGRLIVWFFIPLTWVIFAIPRFGDLQMYFARLFPFFGMGHALDAADFLRFLPGFAPYLCAGLVLLVPAVFDTIREKRKKWYVAAAIACLFWWGVQTSIISGGNTFMYFTF